MDPTKDQDHCPQCGRTQQGSNLNKSTKWADLRRVKTPVHNVDGPNKGQKLKLPHEVDGPYGGSRLQSTTWTDPTRVRNLNKSTKWTDPTKGQDPIP